MQANNGVGNDNLEVGIQNMNIGQNPNEPGQGPQNDVIIDIVEEVNQGLNDNNQQNQQRNREQQPIGNNRANVLLNPPNHQPIAVNDNQIVPGGGAAAAVRNQQPEHQAIYAGNDQGHVQNNLRHRNAPPAAMRGRNEILGWNQNYHQDLVFNQHPEHGVNYLHGVPMNLAYHKRAPIALQNQEVAQVNIQGQVHQVNPNVVQGARNNQIREGPGNHRDERVQDLNVAVNRNLPDLQQGYQARNNNDNFQRQLAQHQNNNNALQVPAGPLVDRSVNRQAGANRYHSNRNTNRYTPYMDMRRMSQNAKKMALMIWSMAETAMYVPNRNNNNLPSNPNDRDDDDDRSQHAS